MVCFVALLLSGLASPSVSYETLAKPLPDILADLSPMVGKRIVCDRALAEDRVCVSVRDVDPNELLDKVVFAAAATKTEDAGTITVSPDANFDKALVDRRNAALPELYAAWQQELESPVSVFREKIDVREIANLVTSELLAALPLEGSVTFSRPTKPNTRPVPSSVPDFFTRFTAADVRNAPWAGTQIEITATRAFTQVDLSFMVERGSPMLAYSKYLLSNRDKPGSFFTKWGDPGEAVNARMQFLMRAMFRDESQPATVTTDKFEFFSDRPWNDEPLNAITSHVLVSAARAENKNLVTYLDDGSIARLAPQPALAYFLIDNFRTDADGWAVAQVADPAGSRRRRVNRALLTDLVARANARGYFEFWDLVQYRTTPGAADANTLRLEAAAVGPVAFVTLPYADYVETATMLAPLRKNGALWTRLTSEQGVAFRSLPTLFQERLTEHFRRSAFATGYRRDAGSAGQVGERPTAIQAGLDKGVPPNSTVRINVLDLDSLIGVQPERKYMIQTSPSQVAFVIARTETGKDFEQPSAVSSIKEFVPCVHRFVTVEVTVGEFTFWGPRIAYDEPTDGVQHRPLDKLPRDMKSRFDGLLAEQRKAARGGG